MIKSKFVYAIVLLIFISLTSCQSKSDTIYVATWNLENLFDTVDDPNTIDEEFLPDGSKKWTPEKLEVKLENIAKLIKYMNAGKGPDILGVQEVEHEHLLKTLTEKYYNERNYKIAYAESKDGRGIDNGLIYDDDIFDLVNIETIEVPLENSYPTRYILHVELVAGAENLHLYVNHWPSRRGGAEKSEPKRITAAQVLRNSVDKLIEKDGIDNLILIGDFNDEPENESINITLNAIDFECEKQSADNKSLYNLAYKESEKKLGSYFYRGDWDMIDQIIISKDALIKPGLSYVCGSFEIIRPKFAVTERGQYRGAAIPTYGGKNYLGGYSDHFPVGAKFILEME